MSRGRGEIQRRPTLVGAAANHHQSVGTGDDVAFAKRGVTLDLDWRETDLVLAVAGAIRNDLVAVAIGIWQFGIGFAVFGGGIIDAAAIDHFGLARRAKIIARRRPALIVGCRDRKIA